MADSRPPTSPETVEAAISKPAPAFYVAVLYLPALLLRQPEATSPNQFWIRRFVCAALSSLLSALICALLLPAPLTEEVVFRACMTPLLRCRGFKKYAVIFLSPIFFSLGHLVAPITAHAFCNVMGLPRLSSPHGRGLSGTIAFFFLLSRPQILN